jgi:hypothetical protein
MDCMQACEIISTAHDGEFVDAAALAQARAHADVCAECAAFVRVLDRIATTPLPEAPAELVARIGDIATQVSSDARRPAVNAATPEPTPPRARRDRERIVWLPRVAALASAAAVLLVVISAGGIALLRTTMQTANEESVKQAGGDEALMAAPSAEVAEDVASARSEAAAGPAFVSLDTAVWTLSGVTDTAPSPLVAAGSVTTSLGGNVPEERSASFVGDDRSVLYVTDDDGGYHIFSRVVRTLGGRDYGLVTATPLDSFGVWPSLPGPAPDATDGSPVFESAGYDDRGVEVFVPPGGDTADGFAIAPGTALDDSAAGNPGWTWWEPLP